MKITIHMVKRDRSLESFEVSPDREIFEFNNGIYNLDPKAVNVSSQEGLINSWPELYYFENSPFPIKKESSEAKNLDFLEEIVIENALKQLAGEPGPLTQFIMGLFKDPKKLIGIGFLGFMAYAFVSGLLFP